MIIYKATNIITKDFYIGATKYLLKQRIRGHLKRSNQKTNGRLYNAIKKYGWDNFVWDIIDSSANSIVELYQLEIDYIAKLQPRYNMTSGGEGVRGIVPWNKGKTLSVEVKAKISKTLKGRKIPEETKIKISKTLKGNIRPQEVRDKISKSSKGKKMSLESRLKMSQAKKGRVPWNKGLRLDRPS